MRTAPPPLQMPEKLVTVFVQLCSARIRQSGHIKFMCTLCVCEGEGILKNQTVICKRLLEEKPELLLPMKVEKRRVFIRLPPDSFCSNSSNFDRKVWQGRWISLSDFFKTAESRITKYFEQTLDLFAKLCVGPNMRTREAVARFVSEVFFCAPC